MDISTRQKDKDNMVINLLILCAIGWIVFGLIIFFILNFIGIKGLANSFLTTLILFLLLMWCVDNYLAF